MADKEQIHPNDYLSEKMNSDKHNANIGRGIQPGILELEGMEFHVCHGCLPQEKTVRNLFTVDFRAELDMTAAAESDDLRDALDYGLVYDVIRKEMEIHSDLLEHLAGRIVSAIADAFPRLGNFSIRVSKRRPPVNGVAAWSRVTLFNKSKSDALQ